MAIPKDVKRHAEAAIAAHAEVYKEKPEEDKKQDPVENIDPVEKQDPVENIDPVEKQDDKKQPEDNKEETTEATEYVPPKKDKKPENKKDVDWEHKYNTLQGMWRADTRALQDQITTLQNDLATAQAALAATSSLAPKAEKATDNLGLSQEEIDEYGEDLINVIKKAASTTNVVPEVDELKAEIANLKATISVVNEKSTQNDKNRVLSDLTAAIPDWEEQNADPQFISWLEQQDPYSGMQRQQLLDTAMENNDSNRVINFFKGFRAEYRITQTPKVDEPKQAKLDLEDATAPGKTRSNDNPTLPGNKQTWTQAQVAQFYKDVSAGKYANNQKEKRKIEQQIISAGQEGRLVA